MEAEGGRSSAAIELLRASHPHPYLFSPAQEGHQLGEAEALRIFAQIFKAVEYCHRRCVGGWARRDAARLLLRLCRSRMGGQTPNPSLPSFHVCRSAPGPQAGERAAGCRGQRQGGRPGCVGGLTCCTCYLKACLPAAVPCRACAELLVGSLQTRGVCRSCLDCPLPLHTLQAWPPC